MRHRSGAIRQAPARHRLVMLAVLATFASICMPLFNTMMLTLVSVLGLVHGILVHSLTHTQTSRIASNPLVLGLFSGIQPRTQ